MLRPTPLWIYAPLNLHQGRQWWWHRLGTETPNMFNDNKLLWTIFNDTLGDETNTDFYPLNRKYVSALILGCVAVYLLTPVCSGPAGAHRYINIVVRPRPLQSKTPTIGPHAWLSDLILFVFKLSQWSNTECTCLSSKSLPTSDVAGIRTIRLYGCLGRIGHI